MPPDGLLNYLVLFRGRLLTLDEGKLPGLLSNLTLTWHACFPLRCQTRRK